MNDRGASRPIISIGEIFDSRDVFVNTDKAIEKKPFADLLSRSRRAARLSQEKVCDKLKTTPLDISQGTLSAWESGNRLPDADKEKDLFHLAEVLGVEAAEIDQAYRKQRGMTRPVLALTEDELIEEAQEYVKEVGPERLDVWFVGPASLPVRTSAMVRSHWIANLSGGATYRILWFLDQITDKDLRALKDVFQKIGEEVAENRKGKQFDEPAIIHYATTLFSVGDASPRVEGVDVARTRRLYKELGAMATAGKLKQTKVMPEFTSLDERSTVRNRLMLYWQCFCSIVVYSPKDLIETPCANLCLKSVLTSRLGGAPVSPFFWFGEVVADELRHILFDFESEYTAANQPSSEPIEGQTGKRHRGK